MTTQPRDNLVTRPRGAYAMEGQAFELLGRQIKGPERYPEIRARLQEHLTGTGGRRAALDGRLGLRQVAAARPAISKTLWGRS